MNKNLKELFCKCVEWFATGALMIGVALNALNIFPMNVYISLTANLLWLITGVVWRKWSIIITSTVVSAMYILGIVKYHWF